MKSLLYKHAIGLFLVFCIPSISFADTTITSSTYLEDTAIANGGIYNLTLDGSPYVFPNGIHVAKNVTINVEPGVVIKLASNRAMNFFNGTFNALGTKENPITITTSGMRFSQIRFGDVANTVTANLENVNVSQGGNCIIVARSKTILKNVSLTDCSTVPVHINIDPNLDVTFDNLQYTRVGNTLNQTTIFVAVRAGTSMQNPASIKVVNTDFPFNVYPVLRLTDQSNNTFDANSISIQINESIFSGIVKDARFFNVDTNSKRLLVNAENNYWGTAEGPYIEGTLPKTNGPIVPSNFDFDPFKTRDPKTILECCSSVIFIPGIQGSRLYNTRSDGSEDQLWEANFQSDLSDMYLDTNGNSIDPNIYTRDLIDRTNIVRNISTALDPVEKDIYKDTLLFLQNQRNTGIIQSFYAYPYDWRLDLDSIINTGTRVQNGQYLKLVDELRNQANLSSTGKVTIMAHSMGGLLTKRFIQTLSPADQALIDKVVFIAVPHIGTPEGASVVLSGLKFDDFYKNIVPQKYTRGLAENMITAHTLSPSDVYFANSTTKPIIFDSSIINIIPELAVYGDSIDSGQEIRNFITGDEGRVDADFNNVGYPNISPSAVVNKAKDIHDNIDTYTLPENIKIYQIAGVGNPTINQIRFSEKEYQGIKYIAYDINKNFDGDSTVVRPSASFVNTPDTYYLNLYKYNQDTNINNGHRNISGLPPVTNILSNIIKNEGINKGEYFVNNPDLFSGLNSFTIGMHSPVDVHLYDASGRHTGPVYVDINGEVVRFIEENIPNTSYNEYGEDKYITGIDDQNYTLKLDGYSAGTFSLDIQRHTGDIATNYESFNDLPATDTLGASINIVPTAPINSIILDTNGDSAPDIQANNDGTIIDFNKEEEKICKKEKDHSKGKDKDKDKKCKKDKPEKNSKDKKENHKKSKKWHDEHGKHYKNN